MIATLGTVFLLAVCATPAFAQIDLDSLLGELNFGDSSLVSDQDQAADADADADAELLSAPEGRATSEAFSPPETMPADPVPASPERSSSASDASPLQPVPAPPQVNFNEMFQQQQAIPTDAAMTAPHRNGCGCSACRQAGAMESGAQASFAEHRHGAACDDAPYECRPHMRPTLPPPSTMRQYFHSRNANSDIWAGYEREAQRRDDHYYKHVRGECDCFKDRSKKCLFQRASPALYRQAVSPQCDRCNQPGCDCLRH